MHLQQATYVDSGHVLAHVVTELTIDGTDFYDKFWPYFWDSFSGGGSDARYTLVAIDTFLEYVFAYQPASPAQQTQVRASLYDKLDLDPTRLLCVDVED